MKLHRFIGDFDFSKNEIEIIKPENIKQVKNILRLKIGENIVLANGKGIQYKVQIISLEKDKIKTKVIEKIENKQTQKKVNLYLAILKKENFELAIQKTVECGVSGIIPIITERTVKTGLNIERLNKIILEASEQCERSIIPKLYPIMNFENSLKDGLKNEEKIIFHTQDCIEYAPDKNAGSASIFIGPEGGFTEKEINLAKNLNYTIASLGNLILRAETGAIIATYISTNKI